MLFMIRCGLQDRRRGVKAILPYTAAMIAALACATLVALVVVNFDNDTTKQWLLATAISLATKWFTEPVQTFVMAYALGCFQSKIKKEKHHQSARSLVALSKLGHVHQENKTTTEDGEAKPQLSHQGSWLSGLVLPPLEGDSEWPAPFCRPLQYRIPLLLCCAGHHVRLPRELLRSQSMPPDPRSRRCRSARQPRSNSR